MIKAIGHCTAKKRDNYEFQKEIQGQKEEVMKIAHNLEISENEISWFIDEKTRSNYSDSADGAILETAIDEACINPI